MTSFVPAVFLALSSLGSIVILLRVFSVRYLHAVGWASAATVAISAFALRLFGDTLLVALSHAATAIIVAFYGAVIVALVCAALDVILGLGNARRGSKPRLRMSALAGAVVLTLLGVALFNLETTLATYQGMQHQMAAFLGVAPR